MKKLVVSFIDGNKKIYESKKWNFFQHIHSSSMMEVYDYDDNIIAIINLKQTMSVEMIEEEEEG